MGVGEATISRFEQREPPNVSEILLYLLRDDER